MALARRYGILRRQADRLFGSVVRYWVKTDSGELTIFFACGCCYSEGSASRPGGWFCRRHRGRVSHA